jgi:4-diphosphocytidyl-2C-methyl-D-erythritol kinase
MVSTDRSCVPWRHLEPNSTLPLHPGAGLGGGSGNAATTLWAANEMTGRPATNDELLAWSGDIGSDISVFFSRGAAYCTGRGEIVENVQPPVPLDTPMLLVSHQPATRAAAAVKQCSSPQSLQCACP